MFLQKLRIGNKNIEAGGMPFVIAEAGVNHNGSLETAYRLIDEARRVGADAVKFQSFRAERLVSPETPKVAYQKSTTDRKETHYAMIKKLEIDDAFQRKLFRYCKKKGILFLSTPYDVQSAKFLNKLGVVAFKIASADIVDLPLHEYVASTGKPAIVSVGMATLGEIEQMIRIYRKHKNRKLVLLHCVSNYPASHESLNLRVIPTLRTAFGVLVGYSDHAEGDVPAIVASTLGAVVFEKHFTLDKTMSGPDHKASATPEEFLRYTRALRAASAVLGDPVKRIQPEEENMRRISRKSLVAARDIPKGAHIAEHMLTLKRPGYGIQYADISYLIGRKAKRKISKNSLLSFDLVQ